MDLAPYGAMFQLAAIDFLVVFELQHLRVVLETAVGHLIVGSIYFLKGIQHY